jgi:hypothetical protein
LAALVTGAVQCSNLKGALDASADLLWRLTTNWRAGCEKFACPVRREGRSLSFVPTPIQGPTYRSGSGAESENASALGSYKLTAINPIVDRRTILCSRGTDFNGSAGLPRSVPDGDGELLSAVVKPVTDGQGLYPQARMPEGNARRRPSWHCFSAAQRNDDLTDPRILLHVAVCRGVFIQSDKDPIDLRPKAAPRPSRPK